MVLQQQEASDDDVDDEVAEAASEDSKEEEFLAICKLRGVAPGADLALQLRAVEQEYHMLKETGQSAKADHVQSLHAWRSKRALQVRTTQYIFDDCFIRSYTLREVLLNL